MSDDYSAFTAFLLSNEATVDIDLPDGNPMFFPAGSDNRVRITVHSPATVQYMTAKAEYDREATKRAMAAAGVKDKKHVENKFAEADFLAAITKEIHNFPYPGGAQALYRNNGFRYINEQVDRYVGDMGNFYGAGKPL